MLLYSLSISNRLRYTVRFVETVFGIERIEITDDPQKFSNETGIKINYSRERISGKECWIQPHGLLSETGVKDPGPVCFDWKGVKAFFKTGGDPEFDILSAIFFLLSRYEEYLPHEKDMYGRFAHQQSLAFRNGFLAKPVIDHWLEEWRVLLGLGNTGTATFQPTYDIDEAWSYLHKSGMRSTGASIKNFLKGDLKTIAERNKVRAGILKDPFDSYEWMDDIHSKYRLNPIYFFLVPGKTGKLDRNILPSNPALQELIRKHSEKYEIGIHPSWQSGDDISKLQSEKATLEKITGKKITRSRQHFIRFKLPGTFRELIAAGITDDYSMGYGSVNSFRASTARSFNWYDLDKEQETGLRLHPFCYMDANSFFEQKQSPEQALSELQQYYDEVKGVKGNFISIWHNTFLGTAGLFNGWRDVYESFIRRNAS